MCLAPPGCLIGYVSKGKPQTVLVSCESESVTMTGSPGSQPEASPAVVIPAEEAELKWTDITQLLKEKLTSGSFTKTLRYSEEHEHV